MPSYYHKTRCNCLYCHKNYDNGNTKNATAFSKYILNKGFNPKLAIKWEITAPLYPTETYV